MPVDNFTVKRVVVDKVLAPKPYDLLADQLRESILLGDIAEGEVLPPERELVEQTGLTRGSVREALKQLASEGLLRTKPGRFGGNTVTLPGRDVVTNSLSQFVRGRRMSLRELNETREVLEPAMARLAAEYRSDGELSRIKAAHQELIDSAADFHRFSRANITWHRAVAHASGNELLSAVLEAISYGVAVSTTVDRYDDEATRRQVIRVHGKITEAIDDRDGDAAERLMSHHLGATHARATDAEITDVPLSEDDTNE
ncbi:FadR/GntR family transcriptional regulator [Microbacterium pygmaeum]|uniref:DNA-binding transcriptional regulator, FadR family n=1 Tax=Microbacterium pygmaeum TaxID=370764 RepID=A0A1G7XLC2_9MICO|nr:FCD domain-containing protein [Microbacterium pygmaeum]SDG84972.1 DNA-binding transcriptional regulator, FadR family [Microbacterium pygmaeum]